MTNITQPFSPSELQSVFLRAVTSMQGATERWQQRAETGLSDDALCEALRYELGIYDGSCGGDRISIAYIAAPDSPSG